MQERTPHLHLRANSADNGQDDHGAHGVGDEGCGDEHKRAEDGEDGPDAHAGNHVLDGVRNGGEESAGLDGLAERGAAHRQHHHVPQLVVEIILRTQKPGNEN